MWFQWETSVYLSMFALARLMLHSTFVSRSEILKLNIDNSKWFVHAFDLFGLQCAAHGSVSEGQSPLRGNDRGRM